VAQLASVLAWGARGRKFESSRPDRAKGDRFSLFLWIIVKEILLCFWYRVTVHVQGTRDLFIEKNPQNKWINLFEELPFLPIPVYANLPAGMTGIYIPTPWMLVS